MRLRDIYEKEKWFVFDDSVGSAGNFRIVYTGRLRR